MQPLHRLADRLHRAVCPRTYHLEEAIDRSQRLPLEDSTNRFGLFAGQRREIGEGALDDAAAFAGGLAQQNGGGRIAIGDNVDVHGLIIAQRHG